MIMTDSILLAGETGVGSFNQPERRRATGISPGYHGLFLRQFAGTTPTGRKSVAAGPLEQHVLHPALVFDCLIHCFKGGDLTSDYGSIFADGSLFFKKYTGVY